MVLSDGTTTSLSAFFEEYNPDRKVGWYLKYTVSSSLYLSQAKALIDHFTVLCLVAWPLNESEAGVDLVLIETSLLFLCKFLLISMRTASLT